jgi:hypothetical protein
MSKLDAAQKKWLADLGVIVGGQLEEAPVAPQDIADLASNKASSKTSAKASPEASPEASAAGAKAPSAKEGAAMAIWKTQRTAAVSSLKAVAGKIAAAKHASSAHAVVEIQVVLNKLSVDQPTPPQVTELQRYLGADDIVNDVCELADDIRTPLLDALGQLQTALAA